MSIINLKTTWEYFSKSNSKGSLVAIWIAIYYGFVILLPFAIPLGTILSVIILGILSIFEGLIDNIEYLTIVVSIGSVFLPFLLIILLLLTLVVYLNGSSLRNYEKLKNNFSKIKTIDDQGKDAIRLKLSYGIKYSLILFVYFLPLYIIILFSLGVFMYVQQKYDVYPENSFFYTFLIILFDLLLFTFVLIYKVLVKYILRPSINNEILESGYIQALNPLRITKRIIKNFSEYMQTFIFLLVPNAILLMTFFIAFVLTSIFVGYLILPILYGLSAILFIYIEPHIMSQAFHNKK